MSHKKKLLRQLTILAWCAALIIITVYFFLLVPDSFEGWKDYFTYHIFFLLLFLTAERRLLPWITNRLHKGWWVCVYPFVLQFLVVFLLVLLVSVLLGGLVIEDGWSIVNLWHSIIPLLLPNSLAIFFFISRSGLQNWQNSEGYRLQLLNQELVPHMLNANLTKLRPLILLNQKSAVRFVKLNNSMFHYYLTNRKKLSIPICEELKQVDVRLKMQEISSQKAIFLKLEIDPRVLNKLMPTMLLVNLIENSFSYGVLADADKPIKLCVQSVGDDRVGIHISNYVKGGAKENVLGTGTSLSRTKSLLQHLDPHSMLKIDRNEQQFTVFIIYSAWI